MPGWLKRLVQGLGPILGLLVVVAVFAFWSGDMARIHGRSEEPLKFLSENNLRNIVNQTSIIAVCAIGATLVVILGGIDLSVGSVVALASVSVALTINAGFVDRFTHRLVPQGMPNWLLAVGLFGMLMLGHYRATRTLKPIRTAAWIVIWLVGIGCLSRSGGPSAVFAGIFVGLMCGYLNGVLIGASGVVPFIITLGTMEALRGITEAMANETKVNIENRSLLDAHDPWLAKLTQAHPEPEWLIVAPSVWIMLILALGGMILLGRTKLGRYIFAIGSNEEAARLSGVPVASVKLWVYSLAGLLAGCAGVLQFSRLTNGDPTAGRGYELEAIAAVVIGGGSLRGGEGSIFGAVLGALLMGFLRNGCNLANIPNSVQRVIIGGIIIVAVAVDEWRRRSRSS
jgi:ribose/xylose/arabinose/galactoside ABC-type transport system permease subunit